MNDPLQLALAVGLVAAVLVFGYLNRAKFERQQEQWQANKRSKPKRPKALKRPKAPDGRTRRPKG